MSKGTPGTWLVADSALFAPLPSRGLLSARPAATGSKRRYTATDVNGGTEYEDAAVGDWEQVTSGLTVKGTELFAVKSTSDFTATTSDTSFHDCAGVTGTIPAGTPFRLVVDTLAEINGGTAAAGSKPALQWRVVDVATSTTVYLFDIFSVTLGSQTGTTWDTPAHSETPTQVALGSATAVKLQICNGNSVISGIGTMKLSAFFGLRPIRFACIAA